MKEEPRSFGLESAISGLDSGEEFAKFFDVNTSGDARSIGQSEEVGVYRLRLTKKTATNLIDMVQDSKNAGAIGDPQTYLEGVIIMINSAIDITFLNHWKILPGILPHLFRVEGSDWEDREVLFAATHYERYTLYRFLARQMLEDIGRAEQRFGEDLPPEVAEDQNVVELIDYCLQTLQADLARQPKPQ